ncbi:MAG: hypothetical protein II621_10835 [Clostridia bacterium]|jgi:hypothetical protein|nr:hypothetical protein [Clostridia bacterium]MBQ4365468.1 hypothetical protein [Clostridia bacterium]MBQ6093310.1 hypothetical protein [Clostridia bacterium]
MNLDKLLRCVSALLCLTRWLRQTKKALTVLTLLVLCGGALGLLMQKKNAPKKLKKALGRVIG